MSIKGVPEAQTDKRKNRHMTRNHKLLLTLIGSGLIINLIFGVSVYSREAADDDNAEALRRLGVMMRVMMMIRQDYVDPEAIDYQTLISHALRGMVSQLDPYSAYMMPEEYQRMIETTEGRFGGIGIIITMRENVLTIVSPIEDTPGSRAGLRAGDQIIAIDGKPTLDMKMEDAIKKMKGEPDTEVELEIYRPDENKSYNFTIIRDIIEVSSVKNERMLDDKIAYLQITQFNETTAERLDQVLGELAEQGMESLIIDLRNNPGGLLAAAVEVASRFLTPGELIVYTEGRRPEQYRQHKTRRVRPRYHIPLAILINQGSASASEIVAGGLRDNQRAILVGEKTFGKGSVQSLISLPDGSALRLTTAYYYTPSREVIHENGIAPDIEVKLTADQIQKLNSARREAAEKDEPLDFTADPQLQRALELLQSYNHLQTASKR